VKIVRIHRDEDERRILSEAGNENEDEKYFT
jgi:hypothetical protein